MSKQILREKRMNVLILFIIYYIIYHFHILWPILDVSDNISILMISLSSLPKLFTNLYNVQNTAQVCQP